MTLYEDQELPTRPDHPKTVARKCRHCGKVYGEHAQGAKPVERATCGGLRRDYSPEDHAEADHVR